jgi:glutamate dehydrogenase/leucine dehydrogenase
MEELLRKFEQRAPEIVFEWNDTPTGAKGWVVINSLRGGAAGGGTRMRKGLDRREVESLAKTMEVKFTVSGPAIGGAKSGIDFDPQDPRKREVLQRWYRAVSPLLRTYYGTGGDMNVDELHEVIPLTEKLGLWHPQEGVLRGHHLPAQGADVRLLGQLRRGVSKVIEDAEYTPVLGKYAVADMITGWGVAQSVRHYYRIWKGDLRGKRCLVQGWGNVASAAAYYLGRQGVHIVGILDRDQGILAPEGLPQQRLHDLFVNKKGNVLNDTSAQPHEQVAKHFWDQPAEIFLPCAASRLVTQDQLDRMLRAGLQAIASGANVPFADKEIFYGPIAAYADAHASVLPDFIANCGMARVFAYCMQEGAELSDRAIFDDVARTVGNALELTFQRNPGNTSLTRSAFAIALEQLT